MAKIKLTYFRESGKYYSSGEFESGHELLQHWKIIDEVKSLMIKKELPGLFTGHINYTVLVESVCGELVPHILTMDVCIQYPPEKVTPT